MSEEKKSLYSWLFDKSEEEKELEKEISQERDTFENNESYLAHKKKLDELYEKLGEASKKRRAEGRKHRRPITPVNEEVKEKVHARKEREKSELPESVKKVLEGFKSLSDREKRMVGFYLSDTDEFKPYSELDKYSNPDTTPKHLLELHAILVQTVIDFINDNGLKDIDEVHFSADGLQSSADHGEWCPNTDSYLGVLGLEKENPEDKWSWVRRFIGEDY